MSWSSSVNGGLGKGSGKHEVPAVCRYGFDCDRPACIALHPHGRRVDNARAAGVPPPPFPAAPDATGSVGKAMVKKGVVGKEAVPGFQMIEPNIAFANGSNGGKGTGKTSSALSSSVPYGCRVDNARAAGIPPPPFPPALDGTGSVGKPMGKKGMLGNEPVPRFQMFEPNHVVANDGNAGNGAGKTSSAQSSSVSGGLGKLSGKHAVPLVCRYGFDCDRPACICLHPHGRGVDNARAAGIPPPSFPPAPDGTGSVGKAMWEKGMLGDETVPCFQTFEPNHVLASDGNAGKGAGKTSSAPSSSVSGGLGKGSGKRTVPSVCTYGFDCDRPACICLHPHGRGVDNARASSVPPPPFPPAPDATGSVGKATGKKGMKMGRGKGIVQTICRYGSDCTKSDCWYLHPGGHQLGNENSTPHPNVEPTSRDSNAGKCAGKTASQQTVCWNGFDCNRSGCVFLHPTGRRIDNAGNASSSSQVPSASADATNVFSTVQPELLFIIQLRQDVVQQLKDGMLYHLNRFLQRQKLQGRILDSLTEGSVEILSMARDRTPLSQQAAAELEASIQEELARLVSLRVVLTESIPFSQRVVHRLLGPRGEICQLLCRDLGVQIRIENSVNRDLEGEAILQVSGTPAALDDARQLIYDHLFSFLSTPPRNAIAEMQHAQETQQTIHIFVDNSNISIGCQFLPDGKCDFLQRLSIPGFTAAVVGVRQCRRKVVVGSKPPRTHRIWQAWEKQGYQVLLEWRDQETNREQFVDARLVGEALMHIMSLHTSGHPPGVLALCTGDGNLEGEATGTSGANFRNLAKSVVRFGWTVEVWSWRTLCNSAYHRMAQDPELQGRLKVRFLDGLRNKVTFGSLHVGLPVPSAASDLADHVEGEEVQDDLVFDLCVICFAGECTHGFHPCGHNVICETCAELMLPHQGRAPLGLCCLCQTQWTNITSIADVASATQARHVHES